MRGMHRDLRRQPNNTALRGDYDSSAAQLRATQLLIAGETNGSGLYQLRPDDTLAAVAQRTLGDSLQWGRIYDKNRHVLENPDRVIAGITLILP
jgi:nucleoid-associated protein YgaU